MRNGATPYVNMQTYPYDKRVDFSFWSMNEIKLGDFDLRDDPYSMPYAAPRSAAAKIKSVIENFLKISKRSILFIVTFYYSFIQK